MKKQISNQNGKIKKMVVLVKTFDHYHQLFELSCSFKMFKIIRSFRFSKCIKTTVKLTFPIQKEHAFSPPTGCSVFNWKYLFWVNLGKFNSDVHFFVFSTRSILFLGNLLQKSKLLVEAET